MSTVGPKARVPFKVINLEKIKGNKTLSRTQAFLSIWYQRLYCRCSELAIMTPSVIILGSSKILS